MSGMSRRPLALLLCCLFGAAAPALAEVPGIGDEPVAGADGALPAEGENRVLMVDATGPAVELRRERRFNVRKRKPPVLVPVPPFVAVPASPVSLKSDDALPMFIVADEITGRSDDATEASGTVELRKADMLIFADRAVYYPLQDEIDATGAVRMIQEGAEIDTPHLKIKVSDQIGFAEQAHYVITRDVRSRYYDQSLQGIAAVVGTTGQTGLTSGASSSAHMMQNVANSYGLPTRIPLTRSTTASGDAERIDFEGEGRLRLREATYSTCAPGDPDWYMQSAELKLDYGESRGEVRDATVWFKDVPIAYAPYADFSLNHKRKSGFLHPTFASSTRTGFDLTVPYYWNLAPNYDMTLYPRQTSKRGFVLGSEMRYLDHNYVGTSRFEYMPEDTQTGRSRSAYNIMHTHNLGQGLTATLNLNGVSDDLYWQDMSSRLLMTSSTLMPRQATLAYTPASWLTSSLQVLQYQVLQPDPANPVERPYFLEPMINLFGYLPGVMNSDIAVIGQFGHFTHPTKVQGDRMVFYPQVSMPLVDTAYQVIPKLGLHVTQYSLTQQAAGTPASMSRVVPTLTVDAGLTFERELNWLGREHIQTLEPRLYYVNIPYRDQSLLPVFDTGLSDFGFAQIFTENRYSGFDRISDANQLTAAMVSRMIDAESGNELFKGMIGQRYYFRSPRVTLNNTEVLPQQNFSNLILAGTGLIASKTYFDSAWEYDHTNAQTVRMAAGVRYQPDYSKVFSASYRYTRDPLTQAALVDQVDFAAQWPVAAGWYGVARYNYSIRDSRALETIAGLEYNAGCWAVRGVAQRLQALTGPTNTSFFLQLELSDFGSVGSNPIQLLRRTIPGYGKSNELPSTGSLLTTE